MGQSLSLIQGLQSYLPSFLRQLFGAHKYLEAPSVEDQTHDKLEPSPTFQSLPTEIRLHIFSFLELRPYIISHGVCKDWRHLLPLANMHPTRRRLLDLYHSILSIPGFEKTLEWTLENLQPFDRQAYVDALLAQYPVIPEEFRMWIMEWPERLAISCIWPALPFVDHQSSSPDHRFGVNWLSFRFPHPQLVAPRYKSERAPDSKRIPALLVWRSDYATDYLIFDQSDPSLFGRVYRGDWMDDEGSGIIPSNLHYMNEQYDDDDSDSDDSHNNEDSYIQSDIMHHDDWICFLQFLRLVTIRMVNRPPSGCYGPIAPLIEEPIRYRDCSVNVRELPCPMWPS